MGRLLDALRQDSECGPVATPATLATFQDEERQKSQSRKSRSGGESENQAISNESRTRAQPPDPPGFDGTTRTRARLLNLAADELLPARLARSLPDADVAACAMDDDATLRAYLRALAAHERMDKGLPPLEWGEPVACTCEGCGPVLLWSTCPAVVKACPWCFRRKAGKPIPRPMVACADCRHFRPNAMNPVGGGGDCGRGHVGCWPRALRRCPDKVPKGADSLLVSFSVDRVP